MKTQICEIITLYLTFFVRFSVIISQVLEIQNHPQIANKMLGIYKLLIIRQMQTSPSLLQKHYICKKIRTFQSIMTDSQKYTGNL